MKKKYLLLFILIFSTSMSYAQQSFQGKVVDTTINKPLKNALISVLYARDSIFYTSLRADSEGKFSLDHIPKGKYVVLISYPKYVEYAQQIQIDSLHQHIDLGNIKMITAVNLLKEVIVKAKPITMKGDTTEYNARSFEIKPNDKVEDLLKQLPGIQVDMYGKITAQGKTINTVLVDGEEFFGSDPKLVTTNIRSDMVDKVQLYDKKSDMATFTGIDDGILKKTINVKLRPESRKGAFGSLSAGAGKGEKQNYHAAQGMLNYFRGNLKTAAYITSANNNTINISTQMLNQFTNRDFDKNNELETWNGAYEGKGIPTAINGGAHFSNKWNDNKQKLNVNYQLGSLNIEGTQQSQSQNNLPNGIITSNSNNSFNNNLHQQNVLASFDTKLTEKTTLKIEISGIKNEKQTKDHYTTQTANGENTLLNTSDRNLENKVNNEAYSLKATFAKKFNKTGRTLMFDISQSEKNSIGNGFLNNSNHFYTAGSVLDSSLHIDQRKYHLLKSQNLESNLNYTEAFTKTLSMQLNYQLFIGNNASNLQSFNRSQDGTYRDLDSLFSLNYQLEQIQNTGSLSLNYKKERLVAKLGMGLGSALMKQNNISANNSFQKSFLNYMPNASLKYNFSTVKTLYVFYSGKTQLPSVNDLNPMRINNDPLNITLGNPNLKPAFNNTINIVYDTDNQKTNIKTYNYFSYSKTFNPIVSAININDVGVSQYQLQNLSSKNNSTIQVGSSLTKRINHGYIYLTPDFTKAVNFNLINTTLNRNVFNTFSFRISLQKNKFLEKFAGNFFITPNYNINASSLQPDFNNNGFGLQSSLGLGYYNHGYSFHFDVNHEYLAKTKSFNSNFNRTLANVSIARSFLKDKSLRVKLEAKDLFNQNTGFSRRQVNALMLQNYYTTIRRYFMLTVSWDFTTMGKMKNKDQAPGAMAPAPMGN